MSEVKNVSGNNSLPVKSGETTLGAGAPRPQSEHPEFIELCALYVSGSLMDDQVKRLDAHLAVCRECWEALQEFQQIGRMGLPAVAPLLAPEVPPPNTVDDVNMQELLARIQQEVVAQQTTREVAASTVSSSLCTTGKSSRRLPLLVRSVRVALPYAAALLLMASAGLYSYRLGSQKSAIIANASEGKLQQVETRNDFLLREFAQLRAAQEALNARLQERGRTIAALTQKIDVQLNQIAALNQQERQLTSAAQTSDAGRVASESERGRLNSQLAEAQTSVETLKKQLQSAREERAGDSMRSVDRQRRLEELSAALKERDQTIQQQRDLLAYDRDIRDLMGARDLYVAEVSDVERDGKTKKPFGRVFFTKGKSLIFYAYDLDKQPGIRNASVFQAWGRRGTDFAQALPLGIMFADEPSHKRWVLKFDDPKALAKIDAVFVTVEPRGGSLKPSSKPLLFAYLKVEPNHP
jgi:hypothetical protein